MLPISDDNLTQIGFISKPSGFAGELIFAIEEGEPVDYTEVSFFFLLLEGKPVPYYVEKLNVNGQHLVVKLEDVNSEAEAKKLNGKKILIERTRVRQTPDE